MTTLFRVENLSVALPDPKRKSLLGRRPLIEILHGLNFSIEEGTVVGIVGESGSGKSTLGRTLVRLIAPSAGTIHFDGRDIARLHEAELRPLRRNLQVIFLDPKVRDFYCIFRDRIPYILQVIRSFFLSATGDHVKWKSKQ